MIEILQSDTICVVYNPDEDQVMLAQIDEFLNDNHNVTKYLAHESWEPHFLLMFSTEEEKANFLITFG